MSTTTRATCRLCGRHRSVVGEISWGGYCGDCGPAQAVAWNVGIRERVGEAELHFTRRNELYWRKRRIAIERKLEGV